VAVHLVQVPEVAISLEQVALPKVAEVVVLPVPVAPTRKVNNPPIL